MNKVDERRNAVEKTKSRAHAFIEKAVQETLVPVAVGVLISPKKDVARCKR